LLVAWIAFSWGLGDLFFVACMTGDAELAARLAARRGEIAAALFLRICDPGFDAAGREDPGYLRGLRETAAALLDYGLEGIGRGGVAVPPQAVEQARRAAVAGVGLDTVVRRYLVGHAVLGDFVLQEVGRGGFGAGRLRAVASTQALLLDRLMPLVTAAYICASAPVVGPGWVEEADAVGFARARWLERRDLELPPALANPNAHRLRECVRFLAAQGAHGLAPSNREIALAIGVSHRSQASRLLALLAELGLVGKRSEGAGKRNAWTLSEHGVAIARALSGWPE
jgi:hypothetical protein